MRPTPVQDRYVSQGRSRARAAYGQAGLGGPRSNGHHRLCVPFQLFAEGPGPGGMVGEQTGFLGAQRRGTREREPRMAQHQLNAAAFQPAHPRPFAVLPQGLEVVFEIAEMAIRAQSAPPVPVAQRMEMLVARERPRLVVQALQQPKKELAHASRLARAPRWGSAKFSSRLRMHPVANVKGDRWSG